MAEFKDGINRRVQDEDKPALSELGHAGVQAQLERARRHLPGRARAVFPSKPSLAPRARPKRCRRFPPDRAWRIALSIVDHLGTSCAAGLMNLRRGGRLVVAGVRIGLLAEPILLNALNSPPPRPPKTAANHPRRPDKPTRFRAAHHFESGRQPPPTAVPVDHPGPGRRGADRGGGPSRWAPPPRRCPRPRPRTSPSRSASARVHHDADRLASSPRAADAPAPALPKLYAFVIPAMSPDERRVGGPGG